MASSISKGPLRRSPLRVFPGNRLATSALIGMMRAGLIVGIAMGALVLPPARSAQQQVCCCEPKPNCAKSIPVDLVFIIDQSGSLAVDQAGQSYNVQVEGVLRCLSDSSVIPRDGSIAVAIETFADDANIFVPIRQINGDNDVKAIAEDLDEKLRCTATSCIPFITSPGFCPSFGTNPESRYTPAIRNAYAHLNQNHRPGARQVLLMSSDGQPTDLPDAVLEARRARSAADLLGVQLELDLILIAPDSTGKENADQVVFPGPPDDLPGKTLVINSGRCNDKCADLTDSNVRSSFDEEVAAFAGHTREVLRDPVPKLQMIVNTETDPLPDTPVTDNTLSLRQAIEFANCNGGSATITFANNVNTITLREPLPALTAPEITICGCDEKNCDPSNARKKACERRVTIDGKNIKMATSDGISIRSAHNTVRGLRIINFVRAGIAVEAPCPSDNVGTNLIVGNAFENNVEAGIYVKDPSPSPQNAVTHNIRTTISMNDISGSKTPIDLGLDGPTLNDAGDLDEGPNAFINFPDKLTVQDISQVSTAANSVTVTGQLNSPPPGGGVVEVFAVTKIKTVLTTTVIDAVSFLDSGPIVGDMFTIAGLPASPTGIYTATVTDNNGNTSELMAVCVTPARATLDKPTVKFDQVRLRRKIKNKHSPQMIPFTITNNGCAALSLTSAAITRTMDNEVKQDDSDIFSIGPLAFPMIVKPGDSLSFKVTFNPVIPRVVNQVTIKDLVPDVIKSDLTFQSNIGPVKVMLEASVTTNVLLIDPDNPTKAPVVTLSQSGDMLTTSFSFFDSNKDVIEARYRFLDAQGREVPFDNQSSMLEPVTRSMVRGQSRKVFQDFSNANSHPEAMRVEVTIIDPEGQDISLSSPKVTSSTAAKVQSAPSAAEGPSPPPLRLASPPRKSGDRARGGGNPKTQLHAGGRRASARQEKQ